MQVLPVALMFLTKLNFFTCFLASALRQSSTLWRKFTSLDWTYTFFEHFLSVVIYFFHVVIKSFFPQVHSTVRQMKYWTNYPMHLHFFFCEVISGSGCFIVGPSPRGKNTLTHNVKKTNFWTLPLFFLAIRRCWRAIRRRFIFELWKYSSVRKTVRGCADTRCI